MRGYDDMNNISELIGIIKGINFDGVVNDLEKKRLLSWVNANRELVYDKNGVKMINLIDSILSEHIITETKRRQLLSYSEQYLEEMTDSRRYIDELHGIIIGIICDGKVNTEEVTQLRLWLTKNKQFICENEINEKILYRVEDILSDGHITEEKQNQLLELLSSNINELQAKTKLNDIRQLVRERKNIGLALINILDDENMIDLIHCQAEGQLNEALRSYSCYMNDSEIVFISLCLIGMLDYDGNFYEHVRETYEELYQYYSEQKIEGTIRTILHRYYTLEDNRKGNSRIISIALSNAIVPAYYLGAFFEFIFDIYKLNFEFNVPTNLREEFDFVYNGLRNSMLSQGDDVRINVTRKSYKLIETTKQLITDGKYLDSVIELSIIVVRLIDKHIWSGAVQVGNPYIKAGYETWLEIHHNDLKTKPNRKGTELRSRWEPKLQLCQNLIQLLPPIHRIKMQYSYKDIQILIKNGNKVIYRDDTPDIREIIGGYQISVNAVELKEPLGKITYFLMSNQKIIYSSKKKLYRDYIVFDENGHELQNNNDYKGIAIFCTAPDVLYGDVYFQSDSYVLSTQKVKYDDVVTIGTNIFSFSSLTKPGIFGDEIPNQYLQQEKTPDLIPVFSKVKFLVFESTNDTENFEFSINNRIFRLSDFHYTRTIRQNSWKFVVDVIINQPEVYEIIVFEKFAQKRSRIASFHFGYDPHFEINESKIDNDNYRVSICSDLDVSPIEKRV